MFQSLTMILDIILSLTRTSRVGYLRDLRRLTVALSRARLGLYILGRREVFEACYELREAFELLLKRPDKLVLVTGELWPSDRTPLADADGDGGDAVVPGEVVMEGVEHLGQYVFEMTTTRINQLRAERGLPEEVPALEAIPEKGDEEDMEGVPVAGPNEDDQEEEAADMGGFEATED